MTRCIQIAFVLASGAAASAQMPPAPVQGPVAGAAVVTTAPRIDGRVDDAAWEEAAPIVEFRQKEPLEGSAASEATRVRIVYDRTHLYIAAELSDREPPLVRATELRRDNPLSSDDSFAVLLDTYHDHRNAFVFRTNARGTRFDGVIRNEGTDIDATWDEDWRAVATLDERGWAVEIAIPFKILRYSGAPEQTWGVNFERVIKRKNELVYWAAWTRDFAFNHVSQAGHLTGLQDIRQAERLRVRPYVLAGVERHDAASPPLSANALGEVGLDDVKFALTTNLTADLTVNPDFAQAEVDEQRVNLTRFNLSWPERRQFFIEGADSLKMGVTLLPFVSRPLEIVYTRAIGLSAEGAPIPIIAGGKLTGKAGGFDVGVLNVQTDDADGRPGENFAVARVRKELLGRSYIGAIATNRQGAGDRNRVGGLDARFVFWEHLSVAALAAVAEDDAVAGTRWARQAGAEWRSDLIEAGVNYLDIDNDFRAGVGFVRRDDRMIGARVSVKPRPGGRFVRQYDITPSTVFFHEDDGVLLSSESNVMFGVLFQSGDKLAGKVENQVERLPDQFEINPGVVLPPGRYSWNLAEISFETFNGRKVSGRAEANVGQFYDGTHGSYEFALAYRPGKNFSLESTYELNDVDLVEGSFKTHLLGVNSNVSFTTTLLASANVQYNSAGSLAVLQLRLNYIFRTIDNFYLVYNETRRTAGAMAGRSNRSLVAKMTYSLHR
ncbi:MAG TPA: DUF5916 domain-containing protein [Vicinamibacterales bacterium]|nr:DUF5916 domain-containing protein [Vicinamibacterales bacterium]